MNRRGFLKLGLGGTLVLLARNSHRLAVKLAKLVS